MALYTVRSDRQFRERLQYDLLFLWFLDLNPDEETLLIRAWLGEVYSCSPAPRKKD